MSYKAVIFLWAACWIDQFILLSSGVDYIAHPLLRTFYDVLKFVLHFMTGQSQIQRLLGSQRLTCTRDGLVYPTVKMVRCIQRSIYLSNWLSLDTNWEDLLAKIQNAKKITNGKVRILGIALQRINSLRDFVKDVESFRQTSFERDNIEHVSFLSALWKNLKPDQPIPSIPDSKWSDLGFQGTDPGTDFRGMGLLGLKQLVDFTKSESKLALEIFSGSDVGGNFWFPFAVVGINITSFQNLLLNSNQLDALLYDASGPIELAYNKIYAEIFNLFNRSWSDANPRDIMDFPRIFTETKLNFLKTCSQLITI